MRRSILARVKFLSRLFTALNLLPSIATLACVSRPIASSGGTDRKHTRKKPAAERVADERPEDRRYQRADKGVDRRRHGRSPTSPSRTTVRLSQMETPASPIFEDSCPPPGLVCKSGAGLFDDIRRLIRIFVTFTLASDLPR